MSIILTDSHGQRFRLIHGWGSTICSNKNLLRGPGQAQAFIGQLAPEQTTEIFQTFFGGTDLLPRHLCTPQANAGAVSGPGALTQARTNNDRIADAIERSQLIIEKDNSLQPVADDRAILRVKIRQALNEILSDERQEAARHQALMDQESTLGKSLIYTGAAMTGLGKAAWGLLCWAKEASDLVNPVVRLQNRIKALAVASHADDKLEAFATQLQKEEWREVVEVIGFDPTQITREQMAQAMDATTLIMDDSTLASDLKTFSWNYIKAQHAIELTEAGGAAVFEIILTAILAALTGGAGAIAATASKARHMTKFKKLGQLLVDFAKASKELAQHAKEQAKRAAKSVKRSFDDVKTDAPAAERKAKPEALKNKKDLGKNPDEIRVIEARKRQNQMLIDNTGYNISPTSWDSYPTIGRNGTFITDSKGVSDVIGDFNGKSNISAAKVKELESAMGLEPGTLKGGFKIRKVDNIVNKMTRSPLEGNQYFLGPGNHLPGGAPEIVIESIPTIDTKDVKTLAEITVK